MSALVRHLPSKALARRLNRSKQNTLQLQLLLMHETATTNCNCCRLQLLLSPATATTNFRHNEKKQD